jgi:hypothetical protein
LASASDLAAAAHSAPASTVTPLTDDLVRIYFQSDGSNCCPSGGGINCGCSQTPNYPYTGAVVESCEFRRYDGRSVTYPTWIPIRFPGHANGSPRRPRGRSETPRRSARPSLNTCSRGSEIPATITQRMPRGISGTSDHHSTDAPADLRALGPSLDRCPGGLRSPRPSLNRSIWVWRTPTNSARLPKDAAPAT